MSYDSSESSGSTPSTLGSKHVKKFLATRHGDDTEEEYITPQALAHKSYLIPLRFQKPPKKSLTDFYRQQLKEGLFSDKLSISSDETVKKRDCKCTKEKSLLLTGFGMRNLDSLQNALRMERLSKKQTKEPKPTKYYKVAEFAEESLSTYSCKDEQSEISQTERSPKTNLQYLMGLEQFGEEGTAEITKIPSIESEEEVITGTTKSMRKAQRYLRFHKIFEFFQFLISHLLGARAENPVEFLIELLDKCLLYRSRMGNPPVLYEKKHIEQLFRLMDRMNTGFIDLTQYKTGLETLGISSHSNPHFSENGYIAKDVFIDDAYEFSVDLLDDLLKSKKQGAHGVLYSQNPPPTEIGSCSSSHSGAPYFIPPELFLHKKKEKISKDIKLVYFGGGEYDG